MKRSFLALLTCLLFVLSIACGGSGESEKSLTAPENFTATVVDKSTVQLTWSSAGEEISYKIFLYAENGTDPLKFWEVSNVRSFSAEYSYDYAINYFFTILSVLDGEYSEQPSSSVLITPCTTTDYWIKTFGDSNYNMSNDSDILSDGSIITVGSAYVSEASSYMGFLLKTSADGDVIWSKYIGGEVSDTFIGVTAASDGGFVAVGGTSSVTKSFPYGWVVKFTSNGEKEWERILGGSSSDRFYSVDEMSDGYIMSGITASDGEGDNEGWLVKLDFNGNLLWQNTIGTASAENLLSVIATSDGEILTCGVSNNHGIILKFGSDGSIRWRNKFLAGTSSCFYSVAEVNTYEYVAVGLATELNTENVMDGLFIKLNYSGIATKQLTLGGSGMDEIHKVTIASKGGYYLAGQTSSTPSGASSSLIGYIAPTLDHSWQAAIGGNGFDSSYDILLGENEDIFCCAYSSDLGTGGYDVVISLLTSEGDLGTSSPPSCYTVPIMELASAYCSAITFTGTISPASLMFSDVQRFSVEDLSWTENQVFPAH